MGENNTSILPPYLDILECHKSMSNNGTSLKFNTIHSKCESEHDLDELDSLDSFDEEEQDQDQALMEDLDLLKGELTQENTPESVSKVPAQLNLKMSIRSDQESNGGRQFVHISQPGEILQDLIDL